MRDLGHGRLRSGAGGRPRRDDGFEGIRDEQGRVTVEYAVTMLAAVVTGLVVWVPAQGGPMWIGDWVWRFWRWIADIITSMIGAR